MSESNPRNGSSDGTTIWVSEDVGDWLFEKKERGDSYNDVLQRIREREEAD